MDLISGWQMDVAMDPAIAGIIAGCIHHFLFQFPSQAKLFTTFYAIGMMNAAFVALTLAPTNAIRDIQLLPLLKNLAIFEVVYVCTRLSLD